MNLVNEYINSDPDTQTRYSIIHKKNTIVSTSRLIYSKNKGYINLVYTNPEFRGCKICQNHIRHLIGLHKDFTKKYELEVDTDNIPAIKCYENIGFKKISIDKKLNIYLMRLQI
jgi:ribosomal protein S18 acetylase RimI-like enzyme